jgi:hypothetical protein
MTTLRTWIPVLGCVWLASGAWQPANAQLSINLDDAGGVTLQNGGQPPLVVGPGQSFGGTLTTNGFQGVMSDAQGVRQVQPGLKNPFRGALPSAPAASQPLQINAGGISLSLPGIAAPPAMPRMVRSEALTAANFAAARQLARTAEPEIAMTEVERVLARSPSDPDLLQLKAVLLMQEDQAQSAAACAYDALAHGQCWTWPTLRSCFATREAAERMYRSLQLEMRDKPSVEQAFLMAWWERMLGHPREAASAMERAMKMAPRDPVMARLHDEWSAALDAEVPPAAQP